MDSVNAHCDLQLVDLPSNLMGLPGAGFAPLNEAAHGKFSAMLDRLDAGADRAIASEIELLRRPDIFRSNFALMLGLVARIPNFARSQGCDIGCGIGMRTAIAALFGPARITGIDGNPQVIAPARSWLDQAKLPGLAFQAFEKPAIPSGKSELDWVMMRGVYAGMAADTAQAFFKDCVRVLKPGGLLLLFDSANPLNAIASERIKAYHERMEIGGGSPGEPAGPIYHARLQILREAFAGRLGEEQSRSLARATCYMTAPEILKAAKGFLAGKKAPDMRFNTATISTAPVWPKTGLPAMRPADPLAIRDELRRAGLTVRFRGNYLGADVAEADLKTYLKDNVTFYITAEKLKSAASRKRK